MPATEERFEEYLENLENLDRYRRWFVELRDLLVWKQGCVCGERGYCAKCQWFDHRRADDARAR